MASAGLIGQIQKVQTSKAVDISRIGMRVIETLLLSDQAP
jgi:hypothetical protein